MGAKLSLEHDPDQLEAVRIAEKKVLEYFQAPNPRDVWLELPTSMDDNNNNNENDNNKLCGLKTIRVLQVGSTNPKAPLALFLHGGGVR